MEILKTLIGFYSILYYIIMGIGARHKYSCNPALIYTTVCAVLLN